MDLNKMTPEEIQELQQKMHIEQMNAENKSWRFAGNIMKILIGIAVIPWIIFGGIMLFAVMFG